ncbi:hypothetical protein Pan258_04130 [Symmachiella dynata]|uniref:hypothetical protein n=1 Tax=Symmachiella dynata TaxID=2527995 RepID=UPI00118B842B|nr:hypothetical protein [Symmachiella dynata]QDT46394.1 hypothetical protein Pan258_04130 [Symmachiella dynata]
MSTDYWIFLQSDRTSADLVLEPLSGTIGVDVQGDGLQIRGLMSVSCKKLSESHQDIMREEYGKYGLGVNWGINGTYDKKTNILEVVGLLFQCAAKFVNANPDQELSLMRNGESFYIFNSKDRLILSPIYLEAIPNLDALFKKPVIIDEMSY